MRAAFIEGVRTFASDLEALEPGEAGPERRAAALATLSTIVGALTLARATKGDPISEDLIEAARAALAT